MADQETQGGLEDQYSWVDRMVHDVAMRQLETQKLLSHLEDRIYAKDLADVSADAPVFITSMPRSGTTLLLSLIAEHTGLCSHTYRDLPFLLCPLIWSGISQCFRKQAQMRDRAHGDGMLIGYDTPEAFEEILWKAFWPDHFEPERIRTWPVEGGSVDGDFAAFFRQHMRKVIYLRQEPGAHVSPGRYVSKNNANIARIDWLSRHFPDATFLIPYRDPVAHIHSLLRQHRNFIGIHEQEPFTLRYMESIGHLEFGKALRPIDFDGWIEASAPLDPESLNFWAEYWIAAYRAALRVSHDQVAFIPYDRLCAKPEEGLKAIAAKLRLNGDSLDGAVGWFRSPTKHGGPGDLEGHRAHQIRDIFEELEQRALF